MNKIPTENTKSLEQRVVELLEEMKVVDIHMLALKDHTMYDAFVLGTCTSSRHLKSSAEFVRFETKQEDYKCLGIETSENWVAIDLGSVGIHLFLKEVRELYDLKGLWTEGKLDVGIVENYLKGKS